MEHESGHYGRLGCQEASLSDPGVKDLCRRIIACWARSMWLGKKMRVAPGIDAAVLDLWRTRRAPKQAAPQRSRAGAPCERGARTVQRECPWSRPAEAEALGCMSSHASSSNCSVV